MLGGGKGVETKNRDERLKANGGGKPSCLTNQHDRWSQRQEELKDGVWGEYSYFYNFSCIKNIFSSWHSELLTDFEYELCFPPH